MNRVQVIVDACVAARKAGLKYTPTEWGVEASRVGARYKAERDRVCLLGAFLIEKKCLKSCSRPSAVAHYLKVSKDWISGLINAVEGYPLVNNLRKFGHQAGLKVLAHPEVVRWIRDSA